MSTPMRKTEDELVLEVIRPFRVAGSALIGGFVLLVAWAVLGQIHSGIAGGLSTITGYGALGLIILSLVLYSLAWMNLYVRRS